MDSLIDDLKPVTKVRKTTYNKKSLDPSIEEQEEDGILTDVTSGGNVTPTILGTGFLFKNSTIDKVRARLSGKNYIEQEKTPLASSEQETQIITNLYTNGEDLEKDLIKHIPVSQTQPITNTGERTQLEQEIKVTIDNDSNEMPTQVIGSTERDDETAERTQIGEVATQLIPGDTYDRTSTMQKTQEQLLKTQRIPQNSRDNHNQTNIINESFGSVPFTFTQKIKNFETNITNENDDFTNGSKSQTVLISTNVDNVRAEYVDASSSLLQATAIAATVRDDGPSSTALVGTVADDKLSSGSNLAIHKFQKELEEEEQLANNSKYKEYKGISKPILTNIVKFTKDSFLQGFDNSSSSSSEEEGDKVKETKRNGKENTSSNSYSTKNNNSTASSDGTTIKPKIKSPKKFSKLNTLSRYENKLKTVLNSKNQLQLGSDDESSDDTENSLPVSRTSKATILTIKARLSKQKSKKNVQKDGTVNTNLNKLFENLKKSSRKQILENQRELIENKGLNFEDIEMEKELVENLLEQEIKRNQKIRQREKEREDKKNNANDSDSVNDSDVEFDLSANEQEEQESDAELSDVSKPDIDEEVVYQRRNIDEDGIQDEDVLDNVDADEEEEEAPLQLSKRSNGVTAKIISVSEDDEDTISKRNAIDLGAYGDNLTTANVKSQDDDDLEVDDDKNENLDTQPLELTEQERIDIIEAEKTKIKMQQEKMRHKEKEMMKKGVTKFFEMEAEESEDEWHGIGGIDGEMSDEYDSDVEKMIDDYSKANFDPNEIREMLAAENKEMDLNMINKILYDIKNGGFRKRKRGGLELELSEDEDDDALREYHLKRKELMRKRRLELGDDEKKLVKNPKSKAFFESMVEDITDDKNAFNDEPLGETSTQEINNTQDDMKEEDAAVVKENGDSKRIKKKKTIISEEFVQRTLSFLKSSREDEEFAMNENLAKEQHGTKVENLLSLKQQSSIKVFQSPSNNSSKVIKLDDINNDDDDDEDSPIALFKVPSILKSFGSKTDINEKFQDGNKTVTISKSYRTVGSSKASITYLGKSRKLMAPTHSKMKPLRSRVTDNNKITKGERNIGSLFSTGDDSFEN
ncbi:chromatin-modulating protein MRC1 NDAI_0A00140 [Naumovozyma dairenensis CBS 421]|uniref:DNA replication checkpoint mediator MRC1 domain-containing protein n=1 Tax=Naumovozyma dairenensis (strain ATCC 10597 / BCRC 20456 / CBS 421 / NBRC 0211 / NRRL Y-12639) TaxID=1071378 RepID=G0W5G0_NAUDC|nr:hypothetical protein NDAI_0A00140 [Naumovozyma dairenensis CBS 421]CCD22174.1 hypothetical protein NDAI_0A00140 [Naumovozyma dairenensis CBS 421]